MMNNFELDERAKELMDGETHYNLARRVIELESKEESKMENKAMTVDSSTLMVSNSVVEKYYPIYLENIDQGWSFGVEKSTGIETTGNPTFEQFFNAAKFFMSELTAQAMYYAAWPEK